MKKMASSQQRKKRLAKRLVLVVAVLFLTFGFVGHFWHKYFSEVGGTRTDEFGLYVSSHWYYWVATLAGFVCIFVSTRIEKIPK